MHSSVSRALNSDVIRNQYMNDLYLILVGIVLFFLGFVYLYINVCRNNSTQGAVSETSTTFLLFFGLLAWKKNALPLSLLLIGVVCVGVALL